MRQFNEWLAGHATRVVMTMWAFYVLLVYSFMPLVFPHFQSDILYWSNVIQLVFLPLLGVGQVVLSKQQNKHHEQTRRELHEHIDQVLSK